MIQYDPTYAQEPETSQALRPLFLHCNLAKWSTRHFKCAVCTEDPAKQARRNDATHLGAIF